MNNDQFEITVAPFYPSKTINPYCHLLYSNIGEVGGRVTPIPCFRIRWLCRNRKDVDVLHFHWLHNHYRHRYGRIFTFLKLIYFVIRILFARLLGYRVVWTMHNTAPHDSKYRLFDSLATSFMLSITGVIVHCDYSARQLRQNYRKRDLVVIPHGNYISAYPNNVTKKKAREKLRLKEDSFVILSFGLLRGYKRTKTLIESFNRIDADNKLLFVVGQPFGFSKKEVDEIKTLVSGNDQIRLHLKQVPDEDIQYYFNASDYVAFSFQKILTSGSLMLALSFGRPVVAPKVGCINELVDAGVGVFYDVQDKTGLLKALEKAFETNPAAAGTRAFQLAQGLSWKAIAYRHLKFYCGDVSNTYKALPKLDREIGINRDARMAVGRTASFNVEKLRFNSHYEGLRSSS